jgi:hypothetical protein
MASTILVNATDIQSWANRRNSQEQLPRLLRRLIRATTDQIHFISIRADEGVQLEGFDGVLEIQAGNEFAPSGKSVWEFGTNKQAKGKADKEYEKRKENPLGVVPADAVFVFVTPRRWSKKTEWMNTRKAEGFWREVRVYDADDLETWLELALAVHVWLSILLGKHPETAIDIENFWADWTEVTHPHFSAELLISGRDATVNQLHEWLGRPASSVALRSESTSEAIAFFAAALHTLPPAQSESVVSRCLVVEDISAWRQLIASSESLILIPNFSKRETVARAVQSGHHVLIPLGRSDAELPPTINVPRLHRANAKQALLGMGISEDRAEELATLARRSFLALKRKLAINAAVQSPIWAAPISTLLPALLAGGWNDTNEKDRDAITKLAQGSYEKVNDAVVRWANESDPPVRRVGDTWLVAAREDSWALMARYLTRQDLENFEKITFEVLGQVDPSFELSPNERWTAALLVKDVSHSGLLSEGLAETLAIMAARSEVTDWADSISGQDRANRIVRELLRRANENWHLWASIAYHLPLLAEAAPSVFLEAVDAGLSGDKPVLVNMFSERDNLLTSSSSHTGLLWALERMAWHPDYLGHAALLLAKLTRLDPGGKLGNRPDRSLREVFLCWHPQTMATLDQRLHVIDSIRAREPKIAWRFLYSLLPESHSVGHPTPSPRWREWVPESKPSPTYSEIWRAASEIVTRLLADVGSDGNKWSELIARFSDLPGDEQNAIVERLLKLDVAQFSPDDRLRVWNTLRETISRHREYQRADWSMPIEQSDKLEKIYERFTPEDIVAQNAWLFSHKAALIKPIPYDEREFSGYHDAKRELIKEVRFEAIKAIFNTGGLELVLNATKSVDEPGEFGLIFGTTELVTAEENNVLRQHLGSAEPSIAFFLRGFVVGRFHMKGWHWATDKLLPENTTGWSSEQRADFLSCLPFSGQTWDMVDAFGEETTGHYWKRVNVGYPEIADAERAVKRLLEYRRSQATVEFLGFLTRKKELVVPASLIAEVLMQLLSESSDARINWNHLGYDVQQLIGLLENSNEIEETQIATLEWAYMPILENYGRGPRLLHRELSRNPEFFVEVVSYIYRAEDEEHQETTEDSRTRAELSYKLLDSWRRCPGVSDDGTFDIASFRNWVVRAREKLHEHKRAVIGDQTIGHALAFAPFGSDGAYPHEAVRELIEELASPQIERGIEVQIFNNRGVVTRAIAEGGGQERQIAQRYMDYSKKVGGLYPRTSAMLRRIAEDYGSHAQREDITAELEEDLWR